MVAALAALVVLGLLVLVHELGHFFVARAAGVRILRLSIGFGPRLWTMTRGHTEYAVSLIPLGGYVKMAGEQQEERAHHPWEYLSKSLGARAAIVGAGPAMNYVVAVVTLWAVLAITGFPEALPVVGEVKADMPAHEAGLAPADRIVRIDGRPVKSWQELTDVVSKAPGRPLRLDLEREGQALAVTVTPKLDEATDPFGRTSSVGRIGITQSGAFELVRVGPLQAVGETFRRQAEWLGQLGLALGAMVTRKLPLRDAVTGPIGIVYMTSEALRMGIGPLLFFVSYISYMLAVFNVLPIPILDGGHLLFLSLERLRGRPVSTGVQERAAQVSLAVLVAFVLVVCVNDINRFWLSK
jgi:regulator of sigma E protease